MSRYREQLEGWLRQQEVVAEFVLDVGGSAYPLMDRVATWKVKHYHILDNNREQKLHDKWSTPHLVGDIQEANWLQPNVYNQAFMLEVAEYLYDPLSALRYINHTLKPGGIFTATFPFVYPQHQPVSTDFLRYTPLGVKKLLEVSGFTDIQMVYRYNDSLVDFYRNDGMRMAKGEQHNITGTIVVCKRNT